MRALLIGKRAAVLTKLQAALGEIGLESDVSPNLHGAASLRPLSEYGAVAFGQAVSKSQRTAMTVELQDANPDIIIVDGFAPITDLLVAQIRQALDTRPAELRPILDAHLEPDALVVTIQFECTMTAELLRLDILYRTHRDTLFDQEIGPGTYRIDIDPTVRRAKTAFVLLAADDDVRAVPLVRLGV